MDYSGWMVFHRRETKAEADKCAQKLQFETNYRVQVRFKDGEFEVLAQPKPFIVKDRKPKVEPSAKDLEEIET